MPEMPDLPVEILLEIFDHLQLDSPKPTIGRSKSQEHNYRDLWACAQVSRSFRDLAYPRLFSTVILEVWLGGKVRLADSISQLKRAADMLSNEGNIVRHIKKFCLYVYASPPRFYYLIKQVHLPQILDALHGSDYGIESLSLIAEFIGRKWDYSASDQEFRCAVQNLMRSPLLKHVQLCGIANFPREMLHGKTIQRIELYRIGFYAEADDSSFKSFSLESIGMDVPERDEVSAALQLFRTGSKFKHIYCQVKSTPSMVKIFNAAALTSAGTLKEFHVQIFGTNFSRILPGDLLSGEKYHFCCLTSLRISAVFGENVLNVLQDLLTHRSFPSLTNLTLDTAIDLGSNSQVNALPDLERWNFLDQFLTNPTFSALPKIEIIVQLSVAVSPPPDRTAYDAKVLELLNASLHNFITARQAGRSRDVKSSTVFREIGLFTDETKHNVFVRCGGKGPIEIPSYPNTW